MDTAKKKVLLLDDDGALIYLYKTAFEKAGYDVSKFFDADDALNALREGYDPDAVVFDITMPDSKSGYEFMEVVQQEGLGKRAHKIALTNQGRDGEITRTGELGAEAHLLKVKYTPAEVVAIVTDMLQKR